MNEAVLSKRLARAQAKLVVMERLLEDKSRELYSANAEMRRSKEFLEQVYATMPSALVVTDSCGAILRVNNAAEALFGLSSETLLALRLQDLFHDTDALTDAQFKKINADGKPHERCLKDAQGAELPALFYASAESMAVNSTPYLVCVITDLREQKHLEVELRHAQKLEAVGQLAAGIAHEVNTPVQFLGDSVHFLKEAFADVNGALLAYGAAWSSLEEHATLEQRQALADAIEAADLDFLEAEVPSAFQRTLEGVSRVSNIVNAMKQFSHFEVTEKRLADLNESIRNTLVVATSEYKYVAEIETQLEEVPEVNCHVADINQVLLNLVVNAAHAIAQANGAGERRGLISIGSRLNGDFVEISVSDTGCGIPEEVKMRIFDPFFTTKEVGKGTGQGLALARNVVVDKHGGQLLVESTPGEGSTFTMRLPIAFGHGAPDSVAA